MLILNLEWLGRSKRGVRERPANEVATGFGRAFFVGRDTATAQELPGRDDAPADWSSGPEHRASYPPREARVTAPRRKGQPLPDLGVNRPVPARHTSNAGQSGEHPAARGEDRGTHSSDKSRAVSFSREPTEPRTIELPQVRKFRLR